MAGLSGFGDLPFWDNTNSFPGVPNDGIPTSSAVCACILSNGLSFSYFPIGNVCVLVTSRLLRKIIST